MAKFTDFVWPIWAVVTILLDVAVGLSDSSDCANVKTAYLGLGYSPSAVPEYATLGDNLRICSQDYTCCTPSMENQLASYSAEQFGDMISEETRYLREFFMKKKKTYDEILIDMIENSKQELNRLFLLTYKHLYRSQDTFFMELFKVLKNYFTGSADIDLEQVMEDFFNELFQKMMVLMKEGYVFTDEFWACTTPYMDQLQPFSHFPTTLTSQLKRSFVASKALSNGLKVGSDVINQVLLIEPTDSCREALMRMSHCSLCKGFPTAKPCHGFCLNVLKGCLSSLAELDKEWKNYVDAMFRLSERLHGSFSIKSVLDDIDVQISDSIMELQVTGEDIFTKIKQFCGPIQKKPSSNLLTKRAAPSSKSGKGKSRSGNSDNTNGNSNSNGSNLEHLLESIRNMKEWNMFWSTMPYRVCDESDWVSSINEEHNCWNGRSVGMYSENVMGTGIAEQEHNPEVSVDPHRASFNVRSSITKLKTVTNQLKSAYEGQDFDFIDEGDDFSGSGSGSGSGEGPYDPVEDPKYRPTPESSGITISASWTLLTLLVITLSIFRW